MAIAAGLLGILYGLLHGAGAPLMFRAPAAPRGSGGPGAVPKPARVAWAASALVAIAGSIWFALDASWGSFAALAVGVSAVAALAVGNGFWMKGRPTLSHHALRLTGAAVIVGLAAASV